MLSETMKLALQTADVRESLAMIFHESGRKAVEQRKVVVKNTEFAKFLEWDEITEDAKEGRRIQVAFLIKLGIIDKTKAREAIRDLKQSLEKLELL